MDGWKAGKTADELKALAPPVYLNDADFRAGTKLANYKIEDDGRPYGTGYRYGRDDLRMAMTCHHRPPRGNVAI